MAHPDPHHRRPLLDERCARHQFEAAVDLCRQCGFPFCQECVVYAFGERQPPYCIPCALAAAGVRAGAARQPALPRKELRRRQKEAKRAAKEAAQLAAAQAAEPQIDWSLPITGSAPSPGVNGSRPIEPVGPPSNGSSNGNGTHPPGPGSDGSSNGNGAAPPPGAEPAVAPYPSFDDEPRSGRPQAPATPPKATPKSGLFGRRKNKVVPF